jgi:5'-nucleotidase
MTVMKPRILLTNDDGIASPGLAVLREALEGLGAVTTIAPARNSSGVARSITIERALRLEARRFGNGWDGVACDGFPADCVRVGFLGIESPVPDLVVSGVNLGPNLGTDVTYSGTVGAALEAALRGCPAIAFSVGSRRPEWLDEAVPVMRDLIARVLERGLRRAAVLNVNLPNLPLSEIVGVRPARLGGMSAHDRVFLSGGDGDGHVPLVAAEAALHDRQEAPFGGTSARLAQGAGDVIVDFDAVASGYVAVTPLRYDLLDAGLLSDLTAWNLDGERAGV